MKYVLHFYWGDHFPNDVVDMSEIEAFPLLNVGLVTPFVEAEESVEEVTADDNTVGTDSTARRGGDDNDVSADADTE